LAWRTAPYIAIKYSFSLKLIFSFLSIAAICMDNKYLNSGKVRPRL
jgi:hypothetical protein